MTSAQKGDGRLVIEYASTTPPDQPRAAAIPLDIIDQKLRSVTPGGSKLVLNRRTEMAVPPGSYLVRCQLPSGEFLSEQVDVKAGQESRVLLRPAYPSPHEFLSWAFLLKQIPRAADAPPEPAANAWKDIQFSFWEYQGEWSRAQPPMDVDRSIEGPTSYILAALLVETHSRPVWLKVEGNPRHPPRFVALPPASSGRPVRAVVVREPDPRQVKGARVEPVPLPPRGAGEPTDPLTVLVSSGNLQADLLLGYLADGALGAARRVGDALLADAEQMLQEKVGDPSAATIGGYYILMARKLDLLHDWTRNLDNWFSWLPDGAVIHAWHLLRQEKPDVELARARLLEAEKRGLPLYTQGLRLLFDGLDLLARKFPEDADLRAARGRLQAYASAANWRALTTTFYGDEPTRPIPRPNPG